MRQILDGLAFLHERNIAHLDLKPQNLLLAEKDSCDDIKLCDFGISKVLEPGVTVREILGKFVHTPYHTLCFAMDHVSNSVKRCLLYCPYVNLIAKSLLTFMSVACCATFFLLLRFIIYNSNNETHVSVKLRSALFIFIYMFFLC